MTARALDSIGKVGGPRCCKRDSFLAVLAAVDFVREHLEVEMERTTPLCSYSAQNSQCIGGRCPFSAASRAKLFSPFAALRGFDDELSAESAQHRLRVEAPAGAETDLSPEEECGILSW